MRALLRGPRVTIDVFSIRWWALSGSSIASQSAAIDVLCSSNISN
jgi:hypothetical protein